MGNSVVPFITFSEVSASEYGTVLVVPVAQDGVDRHGNQQISFIDELGEQIPQSRKWSKKKTARSRQSRPSCT